MRDNKDLRVMHVAAGVSLLLLAYGCGANEANWTQGVPILERAPRAYELVAYPPDSKVMGVTPPGFCWTPHDGAKAYRLEIRSADRSLRRAPRFSTVTSTVYAPLQPLEAADYSWQVVYLDSVGKAYGASRVRHFKMPRGVPRLVMPDVGQMQRQLAGTRPRLFLAGERLQQIRKAVNHGSVAYWTSFIRAADAALKEPSYTEPKFATGEDPEWRAVTTPAKVGSAHLARTALAYRITGDPKYLEGARRWMMTLANWDPRGTTSHDVPQPNPGPGREIGVDEAAMPMLERMSLAWDWMGDKLSTEERARVLAVMNERGNQVLQVLHKQDFLTHPFSNHEGRVLAFLGLAGLSFLGDIPDAQQWLDYVLRCYLTSYPAWGGDEGGWSQGLSYWSSYVYWLTGFVEALRAVTDIDLLRRPFYHNTGYMVTYFKPPYASRGAFGDGGDHGPSEIEHVLIGRLADAFDDPVLKWHAQSMRQAEPDADQWRQWYIEDVQSVLETPAQTKRSQPRPPTEMNNSRLQPDIGWAAMHSALGDSENDVWALFKSSRFGSFSHSHADQNTFQLNAYGHALAIDSGYYPWYDSPHDNLWTRQTRAHNGILVNGRGQPPHTWAAGGRIESFEHSGLITVVRGEAGSAYNLGQQPDVARQWLEYLKEPIPPVEPKVSTFERTLAFIASQTRPILVVHDYLKTEAPATFDWLLHSLNRMEVDSHVGAVTIRDGNARLAVKLISTEPCGFSQQGGFPVKPEAAENTAYQGPATLFPDQWHLKAHTRKPASEVKFLAVMIPYRETEKEPEITAFQSDQTAGFRIGRSQVAAWWGPGESGRISGAEVAGAVRMVLTIIDEQKPQTVVCR
jgi:hypothetical protein